MLRRRFPLLVVALIASLAGLLYSQNPIAQNVTASDTETPSTSLKLNVKTVLVDVVVTDKGGHAVPGLTKDDFQILEDGKPQTISFFEPNFGSTPGGANSAAPPALPPNTFTNVPTVIPNDSVNVLLMDALNTAEGDQSYVHKEMVHYLTTLPPGIRIGVFMLSEKLRIIQGFTQDSTVLRAAINKFAANPNTSAILPTMEATNAQQSGVNMIAQAAVDEGFGGVPDADMAAMASALSQFLGQESSFENDQRVMMTLDALQEIAHYLGGVPGRKNLIWFVGSVPHCLPAVASDAALTNGGCPYQDALKKTLDMLADARVSIYPVDARGLTANTMYTAETPYIQGRPNSGQTVISGTQASLTADFTENALNLTDMDALAKATGGKATSGSNDFKGALARDIDNGSHYYTLAYVPTDRKEVGKERNIEVKSTAAAGNYKLAYRHSYFEDTPKQRMIAESAPATDPLRPMMDRGMPDFTELRYRVKIVPSAAPPAADSAHAGDNAALKAPFTRYTVAFSLATEGLTLAQGPDGVRRGSIEVALVAYSQDGKPLNWEARTIGLAIKPEQNAIAEKSGIPFHFDIDSPSGDVYLRTGIYDLSSQRAGTLEVPLSSVAFAQR